MSIQKRLEKIFSQVNAKVEALQKKEVMANEKVAKARAVESEKTAEVARLEKELVKARKEADKATAKREAAERTAGEVSAQVEAKIDNMLKSLEWAANRKTPEKMPVEEPKPAATLKNEDGHTFPLSKTALEVVKCAVDEGEKGVLPSTLASSVHAILTGESGADVGDAFMVEWDNGSAEFIVTELGEIYYERTPFACTLEHALS